jgi:hypothetical protein
VIEFAGWQLLDNNQPLSPLDWRAKGAARWYAACYDNPFLGPFWDRYHRDLKLGSRRQGKGEERGFRPDQSTLGFDLVREEGGVGGETPPSLPAKKTKRELDAERDAALWPLFLEWWTIYPRKAGKQDAFKAFREEKPPQEKLLATTTAYCDSEEWAERRDGERPIPHPATFLRGHRWDDEPTPLRRRRGAVGTTEYAARANGWREECERLGHNPRCQTPTACRVQQAKEDNRDAAAKSP